MPISDPQFIEWLSDPFAIRCTLIDLSVNSGGSEITRYVSTLPYTMPDASIYYQPILNGSIKYVEQLGRTSSGLAVSDLEILNPNGERDSWLDDIWANRRIVARIGDISWDKSDFRVIFDGIIFDINSRNRTTLNIQIRDKLQRLNTAISEEKLGGLTPNKDSLIPMAFGEVHNVTPLLTNPATLEYAVNFGRIERFIEVRDNGVVVPFTEVLVSTENIGRFVLQAPPKGTITCSIQGTKPTTYANTISGLVQLITTEYGKASTRFTIGDLDIPNLSQFDIDNPQPVGYYMSSRENVLNVCQTLANSVDAQLVMSREGKLRLLKIDLPIASTFDIRESDIVQNSLQISDVSDVIAAKKIGYCKNWTTQEGLETGIPQEHKDLYAKEWLSATSIDYSVATNYKLEVEPTQKDTMLLVGSDAAAEATRQLNLDKIPRVKYKMIGLPKLLQLRLGQGIIIYNRRFGMESGKNAIVTMLAPNWQTGKIDVEILV